jgi:glycosyltransferase involved in cell wall biosynthesis
MSYLTPREIVSELDKYIIGQDKAKKAALVPNGVDLNHFLPHKTVMPKDIASIVKKYKKIIGYYGAIAEWFDFDLLNYAAEKRPDYGFIIIGPVDYDRSYAKYSDKMSKNIYFIGPKKYDELPSYALEFDVATIPFVVNKITESTSPIKLFEYMALEKPIVTTDLIECRKYKSVLIAEDKENFVEKLDEAISKETDNKYLEIERKEAENNSWESRVSLIIENLNKNEKDTSNS